MRWGSNGGEWERGGEGGRGGYKRGGEVTGVESLLLLLLLWFPSLLPQSPNQPTNPILRSRGSVVPESLDGKAVWRLRSLILVHPRITH
ncbi:hypothetical protein Pmani_040065 [Petrolisthes manimaculis]|uniref:Uncharacterized protein n=1 Tax=Petrolisthes manimaculis TaxID=1843537 RepID=A0AAE1NDZ8_9EUCA|nr:hypothetical protein Pmani_040065 [Petrolisthes manimaculis]